MSISQDSSSSDPSLKMPNTNVFLFYPNIIGYSRILLAIISFGVMLSSPITAVLCYGLSAALDAVDGMVARKFNQSSRFGAMLDQLTDRCALMAFCMALGHLYPHHIFWFQLSAALDIAAHWLYLHATDLTGADTHKKSSNAVLHLYYTSRPFLMFMCAGNESFYLLLYLRAFFIGPSIFSVSLLSILILFCFPVAVLKSLISLVHLITASQTVVSHDVKQMLERK